MGESTRTFPRERGPARPGASARRRAAVALSVGVLALTGCGQLRLPTPEPEETATAAASSGPLVVGLMTSPEGTAGRFAPLVRYGVEEALDDVNAAGGILGSDVELVEVPEGAAAQDAVTDLADSGATVVVAAVPDDALAELVPPAAAEGITVLAPTSRSSSLDGIPDAGHLFRPVATDTTVEPWLVDQVMGADGRLAYLARDQASSQARAERLGPALATSGGELATAGLYPEGTTDFSGAATAALDSGAGVVLVDGGEETGQVLAALTTEVTAREQAADVAQEDFTAPAILIGPDGADHFGGVLAAEALSGATALRPAAPPSDDFVNLILNRDVTLTGFPYAAPAYDAAVIAVLAAAASGATDGAQLAQHVSPSLSDGEECTDAETCLSLLGGGADIDYQGQSGDLDLGTDGDPVAAQITTYSFSDDNMLEGAAAVSLERAAG